jgi:hypothetical protein
LAIPKDQIPIGEGLGPDGSPGTMFFLDRAELDMIEQDGPKWKFDDARFIEEAIERPDAIFEGLGRPNHEDSFCYSVRIERDPDEESPAGQPHYGMVFVAFVRKGIGFVVFDLEWRDEDYDHPGHPVEWRNDFMRRTWSRD